MQVSAAMSQRGQKRWESLSRNVYRPKFGGLPWSASYSEECMARPSGLVASRSIRPLRTIAGPAVMVSSAHCRLGRTTQPLVVRRRGRARASAPSAARARSYKWVRSASSSCRARPSASRTELEAPASAPRSSLA